MRQRHILLLLISIAILLPTPAAASVFMDISGGYTLAGDAKNGWGMGIGFYLDFLPQTSFFVRSSMSTTLEDPGAPAETVHGYIHSTAGIQYRHPVTRFPLYVTGAAGAGMSYVYRSQPKKYGPYTDFSETEVVDDRGFCVGMWVGLLYFLTQRVSFFAEIGGHWSNYNNDYADEKVRGGQFLLGARFTLAGANRSIGDGY